MTFALKHTQIALLMLAFGAACSDVSGPNSSVARASAPIRRSGSGSGGATGSGGSGGGGGTSGGGGGGGVTTPAVITAADVSGIWNGTISTPTGSSPIQVQLRQASTAYLGVSGLFIEFTPTGGESTAKVTGSYDGVSSFDGALVDGRAGESFTFSVSADGHSATGFVGGLYPISVTR